MKFGIDLLKDKVAVITGCTSGIGEQMARLFAAQGAKVVMSGRREALGKKAAEEIRLAGGECVFIRTDVSDPVQLRSLIDSAPKLYGQLDILVNNAALEPNKPFADNTLEDFEAVIAANLRSYVMGSIWALEYMRRQKRGKILNINSITSVQPVPGVGMYAIAKSGITSLTKSIAIEYAGEGIRCNEICPGLIEAGEFLKPDVRELAQFAIEEQTPVSRLGKAEEIAYAALYLLSEQADFCNGTSLFVDGGKHLT